VPNQVAWVPSFTESPKAATANCPGPTPNSGCVAAYLTLCLSNAIRCIWDATADASSRLVTINVSGCSPTSVSR
jgi:hypothetical protein